MTIFDGGLGTMLQAAGMPAGVDPVDWNLERPEVVREVHAAYLASGAEVITTNTFGANELKYHGSNDLDEIVRAAVRIAKEAGDGRFPHKVALDLGPSGRLLKPAGDLDFETAYAAYARQVKAGVASGADLVIVETMSDTLELKAAVLAAKESSSVPVYATVALDESGKLLTGGSVECVATMLEGLGVDAYGFNCGLGPDRMLPFVKRLAAVSTKPIIVQPNAGLPKVVDGKTVFLVGPEEFGRDVAALVEAGASIVGGCCGTTPAHIEKAKAKIEGEQRSVKGSTVRLGPSPSTTRVSSGISVVELEPHAGLVIGERINPTGKKLLREALTRGDTAYVLREAVKQTEAGASVLDVNCGVPGIDEAATLDRTLQAVESVVTVPVQIDTADPKALALALRHVNGKPLVNSVSGKRESMDTVFPLVKRYGGVIVALCLDEAGIPDTVEGRLDIARRILDEGAKYGFAKADFVFDALTLAVSADPKAAIVTLETVKRLTEELGVNTVLGVSNVSFGLPNRPALNNAMYTLAKRAGLSAAIANPALIGETDDEAAFDVLLGRDAGCAKWIARHADANPPARAGASQGEAGGEGPDALARAVRTGLGEDAARVATDLLARGMPPLEAIDRGIVPALEEVGRGFESGKVFLPQLLMAADAASAAFGVIRGALAATSDATGRGLPRAKRTVIVATVKGDVHDIGKNIVRALLENYGFDVIDLGRDVPPREVVEAARRNDCRLVGLSALMTTTLPAMEETIRLLKDELPDVRTFVGGAVLTPDYAASIGADWYAKDAMASVRIAERFWS